MKQVELQNISKTYHSQAKVLDEIDVTIQAGEFFVLVGPSGCGKSTMLRMIAGLEDISDGTLKIDGEVVNHLPPKERDLAMVFQNYALYPHLSVEQNILFGLAAKKVKKEEQQKRLAEAVEMTGLGLFLKRKPKELSGGQRQRVALARAIVSQAKLCLMDEPLSNLDAKLRGQMRIEIKQLQRKLGMTMIYVTHDQVEAMTMGDRIMVLNAGKVQQIGDPLTLYNAPVNEFVASFIGTPKMNFSVAHVTQENQLYVTEGLSIPLQKEQLELVDSFKEVKVGIRPEGVQLATLDQAMGLVKVLNVEHLGDETQVIFEVNESLWTAKWAGQHMIQVGESLPIKLNLAALKFFNSVTGELLTTNSMIEASRKGVR